MSLIEDFDAWAGFVGHSPATRKRRRSTLSRFKRDNPVWPTDPKDDEGVALVNRLSFAA